jgi:hypothetical protein
LRSRIGANTKRPPVHEDCGTATFTAKDEAESQIIVVAIIDLLTGLPVELSGWFADADSFVSLELLIDNQHQRI